MLDQKTVDPETIPASFVATVHLTVLWEAQLLLGRLYLRWAFYTLAQQHFDRALAGMPDNQEAQEGLKQARSLTTPQLQALAGYFEDAKGFRRSFLYSSYRLYLHPRLRLYGGYGYLTYTSGGAFFPINGHLDHGFDGPAGPLG